MDYRQARGLGRGTHLILCRAGESRDRHDDNRGKCEKVFHTGYYREVTPPLKAGDKEGVTLKARRLQDRRELLSCGVDPLREFA